MIKSKASSWTPFRCDTSSGTILCKPGAHARKIRSIALNYFLPADAVDAAEEIES